MKQKKSVLFLVRLYHPHVGGVEKHVKEVSKLLVSKGYDVTILTEGFQKKQPAEEISEMIKIVRIPIPSNQFVKKFFIWKWFALHLSYIKSADIIHVHDVFYWVLPFRILFPLKKMYITFHGYEGFPIKKQWIVIRKVAEKLTNGSICVGDFMKKWYYAQPTSVIYGGVRLKEKNIMPIHRTAVFFGRLDDQTGILEYLDAYRKILYVWPDFKFTIVGNGPLRRKIPKNVTQVDFKGDISGYILKNHFIFVSRYLSMLEALFLRRNVIATYDNPVKKDYLLMSPFKKYITIAKNGQEIADSVLNSAKTSDVKVSTGYKWAQSQTWDRVVETYLRLWRV